ncbi:hypothetical protein DLAC_07274 [Tieghemostelium lacteum]|uniref:Uncharacterized protein n=1 Tax=Tieghemostelium lacteum TaxID=361077 RepID=A0A151ZC42_TIELA|nr:hypothetical protein DLAC_07274 [Tieghemostelium lacteum]|eukprot:KYQ91516.1 hypothetical protein DLAC_07274 [Tieghemostelium lacteum]
MDSEKQKSCYYLFWKNLNSHKLNDNKFINQDRVVDFKITFFNSNIFEQILYQRQCYKEIFTIISQQQTSEFRTKFMIDGNNGIGKSMFFFYILFKLAMDKSVVYQTSKDPHNYIYFYIKNGHSKVDIGASSQVYQFISSKWPNGDDKVWYICDEVQPAEVGLRTVLITSNNNKECRYFSRFNPTPRQLIMPVWSELELIESVSLLKKQDILSNDQIQKSFEIWGGIPRMIFQNLPWSKLVMDIEKSSNSIDLQDIILHQKVDVKFQFSGLIFASPLVMELMIYKYLYKLPIPYNAIIQNDSIQNQIYQSFATKILVAGLHRHISHGSKVKTLHQFQDVVVFNNIDECNQEDKLYIPKHWKSHPQIIALSTPTISSSSSHSKKRVSKIYLIDTHNVNYENDLNQYLKQFTVFGANIKCLAIHITTNEKLYGYQKKQIKKSKQQHAVDASNETVTCSSIVKSLFKRKPLQPRLQSMEMFENQSSNSLIHQYYLYLPFPSQVDLLKFKPLLSIDNE